ncbi:hypothetical protein [Pimelobacter simplex]|uniref:hypothetical protein n=1 Tax=Nocardioides simplex TaxID=2045 RepID=UPI00214F61C5|nr:hypothetical protein [Pimelobacter simplex]UUW88448.1 hypothetical protein M0M43_22275 [Pimelobacter simplex]UUW97952.1 hypothetical protein M0M48_10920 [Pimelobacter simplex]
MCDGMISSYCDGTCANAQPQPADPTPGLYTALAALLDKAMAEDADRGARSERADVRCLDCGLRYDERQDYGCGEEGRGHSYDDGELAEAAERGRQLDLDCVSVSVAKVRALLDEYPADLPVATDSTTADVVHLAPGKGSGVLGCCGRTPFEVPRGDRITTIAEESTCTAALIERSSFGTPEAVALRASVSDEVAARVVARARELEADVPAPEPSDRAGLSEHLFLSDLRRHPIGEVRLHVGGRLVSGTVAGQVVRDIDDRLAVAEQERAQAVIVSAVRTEQRDRLRDELLPAERARAEAAEQERNEARERYADAVQHGLVVGEAWEKALDLAEAAKQEADALRAQVTAVEARIRWLRERARCVRDGEPR